MDNRTGNLEEDMLRGLLEACLRAAMQEYCAVAEAVAGPFDDSEAVDRAREDLVLTTRGAAHWDHTEGAGALLAVLDRLRNDPRARALRLPLVEAAAASLRYCVGQVQVGEDADAPEARRNDREQTGPCLIETIAPDQPHIRAVYDELFRRAGRHYNLYLAASLRPHPMLAADEHYRAILHDPECALPHWILELLATQAAILGDCEYAAENHGANVVRLLGDEAEGRAMLADVRARRYGERFEGKLAALLAHGEKLTLHPERIEESDIRRLRDAGCSDVEILEATQVTAGFAYWVRYINGLGVRLGDERVGLELAGTAVGNGDS